MRGGALPPAILAAALGLALAFAPRRAWALALPAFVATACIATLWRPPPAWIDAVFLGCWTSVVLSALSMHVLKSPGMRSAVALAINAGLWSGLVIGAAGSPFDLAKALPWVLLCAPAGWIVAHRRQVAVKVAASWLIAVSILAATIPTTTPTPGYAPDHME